MSHEIRGLGSLPGALVEELRLTYDRAFSGRIDLTNNYIQSVGMPRYMACADAQADLPLCCSHMPKQVFSFKVQISVRRGVYKTAVGRI